MRLMSKGGVVSLNPSAANMMDRISHLFVVKIVLVFAKTENKGEKRPGIVH